MEMFNIPIAIFIFKRPEKTVQILRQISKVQPSKIYLIGDGPRTEEEKEDILRCRRVVEDNIPAGCELITNYAETNRGVFENIAGGAKWVFSKEKWAIFLEDDNMPELSFFPFCEELLHKYENDTRVLWICGTNYLVDYDFAEGASYGFTQNMMPCGWASWAGKFLRFYDGRFSLWQSDAIKQLIHGLPYNRNLRSQDISNWNMEIQHLEHFGRYASWDYQMSFSLRANHLLGIVPKYNQITNIGVDVQSIHGGTSYSNTMTRRFCGLATKPLHFPLMHPKGMIIDAVFEDKTARIITLPLGMRTKRVVARIIKKMFSIPPFESITAFLLKKLRR